MARWCLALVGWQQFSFAHQKLLTASSCQPVARTQLVGQRKARGQTGPDLGQVVHSTVFQSGAAVK